MSKNYKGGGTPSQLGIPNYSAQNYKQKVKGSHGLHQGSFKLQTMTALIKSFCGEVQEGQFLQKAPLLAAGGRRRYVS
ncbi:MAG: hypothetical protein PVH61_43895 [Candidatus Aminicenantes bacterium]|jgi:hypothetical protein